ncbi:Nonribosomal peptide synthetase, partial [Lachnellula occidentalis]
MSYHNIQDLLEYAVVNHGTRKVITYSPGDTTNPKATTYAEIQREALQKCEILRSLDGFGEGKIVLLHLNDHLNVITWFWAALYAGCLPAISTPFSHSEGSRIAHIEHLSKTLMSPICITNQSSLDQFFGQDSLRPIAVESLNKITQNVSDISVKEPTAEDTALLMLTSGSTGNAKAVCLSHGQILTAVAGKASVIPLSQDGSFLNWIALDHVASMVEIHIQALFVGADQVHVPSAEIITDPLEFLRLIDRHRVCRTFAPNFFLARLRNALEATSEVPETWDLSCLQYLASGGEANVTETCAAVTRLLAKFGAAKRTIITGFGMTETCAGAIFNTSCPVYDLDNRLEFASVGCCMPGIEMRITSQGEQVALGANQAGDLEVTGPVVFKKYFNNEEATANAFTKDGWFKTGDQAIIDAAGHLRLIGRSKDMLIVNGVHYNPEEIESDIEDARIPGVASSFTACFSSLRPPAQTESIYVAFLPTYGDEDTTVHLDTLNAISRVTMIQTGARPEILPLDKAALQKSTLGKLSRTKIKDAFERGDLVSYEESSRERVLRYRASYHQAPANPTEELLLRVFSSVLQIQDGDFDVETPIFELGITSIELISLKRNIEEHLDLTATIPIITLMTNPTIRSLVKALKDVDSPTTKPQYAPVVTIQPHGTKQPLWLVHPGVGEVLIFLNLARYFADRPIYAFRARGFNKGEPHFTSIEEATATYHSAIKSRQPEGPYLLAGYSYGSMLAVETAKILESNGDTIGFLGVLNLPPHIKVRMQQLDWVACLLHLSYFLDLITEAQSRELAAELWAASRE